jgi:hypothetical protein
MASTELRESWAITLRHLAASRYYLAERFTAESALSCEQDFNRFLHNNEFGLAMLEAEALGQRCDAPPEFWRELLLAARSMGDAEAEHKYAARSAG